MSRTKAADVSPKAESGGLYAVSEQNGNQERYWIGGKKQDLPVYRIPLSRLYFNIQNGRYADRMLLLQAENKGVEIDPREERWKTKIEAMLAGEHRDTARDKDAFKKLKEDLDAREQLRPGVALQDGGVLDGNRRLAALRRLWRETNSERYAYFEAVILPDETTDEERWKIEAGLQLGLSERHDYSPINELIKVRQGLQMYRRKIEHQQVTASGKSEYELVASAIYGKTEADIREFARRLELIDSYLTFIGKKDRYDLIGEQESSEDFKEGLRILTAAENQDRPPPLIAKLRAVLFYLIHNGLMDNWQLREIYHSLGGDPTKRGRKRQPNDAALEELLSAFPDPRKIQVQLGGGSEPIPEPQPPPKPAQGKLKLTPTASEPAKAPAPAPHHVDKEKAGEAVERFLRTQEAGNSRQTLKRIAAGAMASLETLAKRLGDRKTVKALSEEEVFSLRESLENMARFVKDSLKAIK